MIRSRCFLSLVAALVGAAMLGAPGAAKASYSVEVFDDGVLQGGISVIVSANSLLFSGSTTHFSITNGSGTSNNPGGPLSSNLSLSSNEQIASDFGAGGGTHTIQIVLSQTGFTSPVAGSYVVSSSAGGAMVYAQGTNGSATQSVASTYQGFLDNTNTLFGQPAAGATGLQSASASLSANGTQSLVYTPGTAVNGNAPGGTPFSITDVLTFAFTIDAGSGQTTANASATTTATVVPEPCSLVLALAGVPALGIGTWVRRRRQSI
jgi:hypothetical protein